MKTNEISVLSKLIPGFGGYASEQKRRDDDLAARRYLVERLQSSKKVLQQFAAPFVDRANFEVIRESEKLRTAIELTQAKLRAATEGYSAWFESSRVDEKKLKEVVDLDNDLVGFVDKLDSILAGLRSDSPSFEDAFSMIERIKDRFSRRKEILVK